MPKVSLHKQCVDDARIVSIVSKNKKLHINREPAAAAATKFRKNISFNVIVKMGREWKNIQHFGGHALSSRYKNGSFMCDFHPYSFCFFFSFVTDEPDENINIRECKESFENA